MSDEQEDRHSELHNRRVDYLDAIEAYTFGIPHAREAAGAAAHELLGALSVGEGDENEHAIFRAGLRVHSATTRYDGLCIQRRRARMKVEEMSAEMGRLRD
jgi:hypothetical protein